MFLLLYLDIRKERETEREAGIIFKPIRKQKARWRKRKMLCERYLKRVREIEIEE